VVVDHLRKKRPTTVSLENVEETALRPMASQPGVQPDVSAEHAALARAMNAAIAQIRPEYREAIVLRYRQDLSVQEIAETMRCRSVP